MLDRSSTIFFILSNIKEREELRNYTITDEIIYLKYIYENGGRWSLHENYECNIKVDIVYMIVVYSCSYIVIYSQLIHHEKLGIRE